MVLTGNNPIAISGMPSTELYAMAHPRTHVVDVATKDHDWRGKELYELADCALSSTKATINNKNPLVNFDEYDQL